MQTGDTGYFVGRDGVPTDVDFLEVLAKACGRVEMGCRSLYPLLLADGAPFQPRTMNGDAFFRVQGILDLLRAGLTLHERDAETLSMLNADGAIEARHPLYRVYRRMFLGAWLDRSPYSTVKNGEVLSQSRVGSMAMQLGTDASVFMQLAQKVNTYGYELVKQALESHGTQELMVIVDRAMSFYKIIITSSDTTFRHTFLPPMLPVPPVYS
jgi:hypothetical protein